MDKKPRLWPIFLSSLLSAPFAAWAETSPTTPSSNTPLASNSFYWNPLAGRVQGSATLSNYGILSADGMLPVYGNSNGFVFGDLGAGYGSNDSYVVSPGGGYRQVFDNHIWGTYLFADYQQPNTGGDFWDLSPGIEWMNPHWDAHANLYFPTTNKQQNGSPVFANTIGDYSHISFSGHDQFDALVAPYSVMGNGGDVEVGYSLAGFKGLRTRVYVGGYYYAAPNVANSTSGSLDSIKGCSFGVEVPVTKNFTLAVQNSYDNVNKNVAALSLTMTLGGNSSTLSQDVHDRLLDPIDRQVGIIGTGAGAYAQKQYAYTGVSAVQYNNVYFLAPAGTGQDPTGGQVATYEDQGLLDQTTLDAIAAAQGSDGARIYVQGNAGYFVDSGVSTSSLTVNGATYEGLVVSPKQYFYGRSIDYKSAATSVDAPVITVDGVNGYSGFISQGGANSFANFSLTNTTSGAPASNIAGIVGSIASGDASINIENTSIINFHDGLYAKNAGSGALTMNVSNSQLNSNYNANVNATNGASGSLTFSSVNSQFNSGFYGLSMNNGGAGSLTTTLTNSEADNNNYTGINTDNTSTGSISLTAINSSFDHNTIYGIASEVEGVNGSTDLALTNSEANFNGFGIYILADGSGDQLINVSATNSQANNNQYGVYIEQDAGGSLSFMTTNSHFNNNLNYGLHTYNAGSASTSITATNSTFNDSSDTSGSGFGSGIYLQNAGSALTSLTVTGSSFNNNAGGGIYSENIGGGSSIDISATDSTFSSNNYGVYVDESSSAGSSSLTTLGSTIEDNSLYGIYAVGNSSATVTIDYTGTSFVGNTANTNQGAGDTDVTWIP